MNAPPHIADCENHDAELAELFNIHAALVHAEKLRPVLRESPRWRLMRADAYEALMTSWWGGA